MITTLGIDPGASGGIAALRSDLSEYEAHRFPGDLWAASTLLHEMLERFSPDLVVIEKVHSMPRQGVSSTFKFGANYGGWLGMLAYAKVSTIEVTPRKWQKLILGAGKGDTKQRSLEVARRLYPKVDLRYKVDDGKADALHLAKYGILHLQEGL